MYFVFNELSSSVTRLPNNIFVTNEQSDQDLLETDANNDE